MQRQTFLSTVFFLLLGNVLFAQNLAQPEFVLTPKREIPIIAEVDVLVVGGTTGGVAAAVSAAEQGASVFLVAPYPYLGEDMTATLRLWLEPGEDPTGDPLALAIYNDTNRGEDTQTAVESAEKGPMFPPPRPLHVKKVLDDALLDDGVGFLYSSYVTAAVKEQGTNRICGVVISNRQGEQIVLAKTVIDASSSLFSLLYYDIGGLDILWAIGRSSQEPYEFVVVGGEPQAFEDRFGLQAVPQIMGTYLGPWPNNAKTASGEHQLIRYRVTPSGGKPFDALDPEKNFQSKLQAATYHPDIQQQADATWVGGMPNFFTSIPKSERERFSILPNPSGRPIEAIAKGRAGGAAFAKTALDTPKLDKAKLFVDENRDEFRSYNKSQMKSVVKKRPSMKGAITNFPTLTAVGLLRALPCKYDVVVVGGGTSGAPAAIAAARQGAKVLLLEYLNCLGGTGTEGAITNYWWGNRVGFTAEVQDGQAQWVIEQKKQWWRQACLDAGVHIQYGVMGTDAIVAADNPNKVVGVVYAAPGLKIPVFAEVVIDATGSGDIAYAAGAEPMYISASEIAVQGTGLPPKELGGRYRNTDYTFVDETDIFDVTHVFVYAKEKFPEAFDLARIIDARERRRIRGDYVVTVLDQINERTFPDTIVRARSNFDTHGYTVDPYLEIEHPDLKGFYSYLPYRSNLPKGLDGILVAGLATSCERDAIPLMRMQPDLQNQGYALGVIAATAVKDGVSLREVDIRKVQRHLVEVGNLDESVLTDTDNYDAKRAGLAEAVKKLPETDTFDGAHLVFWYPEEGKKLVREAFDTAADPKAKAVYAQVLAVMEDPAGVDLLIEKVKAFDQWDAGWNFRGMGQFGQALSPLDKLILALGRAGDKRAVGVIVEKLNLLSHEDDFSHYRACSIALELLGDPAAVAPLAAALAKPNVAGYVHGTIEIAKKWDQADPKGATGEKSRRDSLIEIGLARALYRLGDNEAKLGESILTDYAKNDLRGHFSRHARLVLAEAK